MSQQQRGSGCFNWAATAVSFYVVKKKNNGNKFALKRQNLNIGKKCHFLKKIDKIFF